MIIGIRRDTSRFEAATVFGVALLQRHHPGAKLVHMDDGMVFNGCDLRVFIDMETPRLEIGAGTFTSFGAVVKHYCAKTEDDRRSQLMDGLIDLVELIDRPLPGNDRSPTLHDLIDGMNPPWDAADTYAVYENAFNDAVEFAQRILGSLIGKVMENRRAREYVALAITKAKAPGVQIDTRILVLEKACPWTDVIDEMTDHAAHLEFVVTPNEMANEARDSWQVLCVPKPFANAGYRRLFPRAWDKFTTQTPGSDGLANFTGVRSASFIHLNRHLCRTSSLTDAIELARVALKDTRW